MGIESMSEHEYGESHIRTAKELLEKAKALLSKDDEVVPHPNPAFRSSHAQAKDKLDEVADSLMYAEHFGVSVDQSIREELRSLRQRLSTQEK